MTRFYISPKRLDTWLRQNKAETLECVEGCLLDSFLVGTKRGYAAIYEHYLNPWSSDYFVEFGTTDETEVIKRWEEFKDLIEKGIA